MMSNNMQEEAYRHLHKHGLRTTSQRVVILRILQDADEHLDAEGIWKRAQEEARELNLATVYRTLKKFEESGLVQQSYLGDGGKRGFYELLDKPVHYHFECTRCGSVLELESEKLKQAYREIEEYKGIQIINVNLKFEGLCADCIDG